MFRIIVAMTILVLACGGALAQTPGLPKSVGPGRNLHLAEAALARILDGLPERHPCVLGS